MSLNVNNLSTVCGNICDIESVFFIISYISDICRNERDLIDKAYYKIDFSI